MYPYHNRIKQRISAGELAGFEFVSNYPSIGECLVLYFDTEPKRRPIRPHRYKDYDFLTNKAMNATKQQLPAHMSTEQYHKFFDSCLDEESGYHNNDALASLQEMIDLSLKVEMVSEASGEVPYTDVALEIEDWENEFICASGDLVFRKSKKEGFYLAVAHSSSCECLLGLMTPSEIFLLLVIQRRLEQTR